MPTRSIISNIAHQRLVLAWASMTLLMSVAGISSWVYHIDGSIKVAANACYLFSLPGWVPLYALGFIGIRTQPFGIIMANAIASAFWILLLWLALRLRSRMIQTHIQTNIQAHIQTEARSGATQTDPSPFNLSRRKFLANATIGTASIGALATPGYATLVEPWSIKVRRYTVPIKDLDRSFEGLKLVQFADTHLGPRIPASFIKQSIDLVIAQSPDLVLLTGDHVHDGTIENQLAAELCKPLVEHASIGAVGVLGNHDWWGDGRLMSRMLSDQGVHMIDNNRLWIDPKSRSISKAPSEGALAIVGFGDLDEDIIDLGRAFSGLSPDTPTIVLSHNPDTAELGSLLKPGAPRVDLMCSGHTHGGQVKLPFLGTPIVPSHFGSKYAGGLVDGPGFPVHISRGIGMSMLPVRIGVPPEISVITLTRA